MAIVLAIVAYRTLPKTSCGGNFSITALRNESRFAGGVLGITFLALLLTQIDKVLLSNLLTLSEYGYYALATVMAGAIFTVAGPITQAWFPRLTELHAGDRESELNEGFHEGAQMVSVLVGSVAIVMIVFSEAILELWIGDPVIASKVSFLVSLIAVGNLLNCLMWMPYQAQLSYGWTSLSVRINVISVIIIIPGLIWTTPYFGAVGAAYLWIALNIGYLFIGAQFMYRKILIKEKWKWYIQDLLSPVLASVLMALVCKVIANNIKLPIQNQLLGLAIVSMLILFAGAMGSNRFRRIIINKFN
jgi:O-antigen/teichoic acid export membrane protein